MTRRRTPVTGETLTLADLVPDPSNRRSHPERNLAMIAAALRDVGAARSIVIDEANEVLAGNGVLEALQDTGVSKLRVVDVDGDTLVAVRRRGLTAEQKRSLAIYDNRTGELAAWDLDQLQADFEAGLTFEPWFAAAELRHLLDGPAKPGLTDPDAVPDKRATDIQRGDLFALGDHRLLCADATDAADVDRITADRPRLCLTDPPYSVDYNRSQSERGGAASVHQPYVEEGRNPSPILAFLGIVPADVVVMTYPIDRHLFELADTLRSAGFDLRRELVWVKDQFSFWPSANYQQRHEPILICVRHGAPLGGSVPANQSTVLEYPRPVAHDLHPTQKPIELWRLFVQYHAEPLEIIFDPFAGSGTTLIACEELGRVCHAMELAPEYCQVIIDRWEAFTGQTAVKVG